MENLSLREITHDDLELAMAWRSDPDIYGGFYTQQKPLTWEEHKNWIRSRNKDWKNFIIILDEPVTHEDLSYEDGLWGERRIGAVTIGQLDHWCPEIGFYVGEKSLWGQGYGKQAVQLGLDWIKLHGRDYVHTTVLKDNKRSMRLLKSLGFKILGNARENEVWLQKKL